MDPDLESSDGALVPVSPPPPGPPEDWLLWQVADSAFPIGGFAHSGGLESAWAQGEIRDAAELTAYLEASLSQFGRFSLPFMTATHARPENHAEVDSLCEAFTTNHAANRASRQQGRTLRASAERIFTEPGFRPFLHEAGPPLPCGHLAPMFGSITRSLQIQRETAARLFVFFHLRGLIAAAVRLGVVGPMQAQSMQLGLRARAEQTLARGQNLSLDDIAQTSPLLEIWQGAQDRLYSRLFQT